MNAKKPQTHVNRLPLNRERPHKYLYDGGRGRDTVIKGALALNNLRIAESCDNEEKGVWLMTYLPYAYLTPIDAHFMPTSSNHQVLHLVPTWCSPGHTSSTCGREGCAHCPVGGSHCPSQSTQTLDQYLQPSLLQGIEKLKYMVQTNFFKG